LAQRGAFACNDGRLAGEKVAVNSEGFSGRLRSLVLSPEGICEPLAVEGEANWPRLPGHSRREAAVSADRKALP
jgi:hypothetical protein